MKITASTRQESMGMTKVFTGKAAAVTVVCAGLHAITTTLVPIGWLLQIEGIELSSLSMFLNTNRRRYRTRICQTITLGRGSPGALFIWRRCGYRRFISIHRFRLEPGHRKAD